MQESMNKEQTLYTDKVVGDLMAKNVFLNNF